MGAKTTAAKVPTDIPGAAVVAWEETKNALRGSRNELVAAEKTRLP